MHPDWQQFLEQHPPPKITSISSEAALMPLSSWTILSIQGSDANSLLQNLFTNDVDALTINHAQLNSLCNPKGRLLAIFWLLRKENEYLLILPSSTSESLLKRLTMYKLRSDVTIAESSDQLILLGASQDLLGHDKQLTPLQGKQTDVGYCLRLPGTTSRTMLLTNIEQAKILAQSHSWHNEAIWQHIDIATGLPFIYNETMEKFTPQQVNLDLIDGVSFSKGCYPGQEIVARLHYLGAPSRRLFSASATTKNLPEIGSEIYSKDTSVVGHIVQAQQLGESVKLLLSLKLASSSQPLFLSDKAELAVCSVLCSE